MHRRPVRLRRSGMTTHFSNQDLSASLRSLVSHIKPAPRKKTYDHRPHEVGNNFADFLVSRQRSKYFWETEGSVKPLKRTFWGSDAQFGTYCTLYTKAFISWFPKKYFMPFYLRVEAIQIMRWLNCIVAYSTTVLSISLSIKKNL